jgi:hypothetical protein
MCSDQLQAPAFGRPAVEHVLPSYPLGVHQPQGVLSAFAGSVHHVSSPVRSSLAVLIEYFMSVLQHLSSCANCIVVQIIMPADTVVLLCVVAGVRSALLDGVQGRPGGAWQQKRGCCDQGHFAEVH